MYVDLEPFKVIRLIPSCSAVHVVSRNNGTAADSILHLASVTPRGIALWLVSNYTGTAFAPACHNTQSIKQPPQHHAADPMIRHASMAYLLS